MDKKGDNVGLGDAAPLPSLSPQQGVTHTHAAATTPGVLMSSQKVRKHAECSLFVIDNKSPHTTNMGMAAPVGHWQVVGELLV